MGSHTATDTMKSGVVTVMVGLLTLTMVYGHDHVIQWTITGQPFEDCIAPGEHVDFDRHRQTQTDTDRHRHTDRHRQTQTYTDRHRQTQTDTDRHRQTQTDTDSHRQTQTDTDRHRQTQ